jgi:D-alanyl-D-alanine carboxypeptidase/D-alanyl-D-alanine-endopeptidase (penicillin-binding protein 4)
VGGEDGTLGSRFRGDGKRGRVFAKTGTLTQVAALSGYAETASGRMIAFSILLNNHPGNSAEARRFIDGVVEALIEFR